MKRKFKNLFVATIIGLFASSAFVSCSNDDDEIITPEEETSDEPIVLSYDTFYDEDDVMITSSDTTTISVSKEYLATMNYKFNIKGDSIPITIWRTIDTAPFVRNVIGTQEQGDRLILTTVSGDLGDMLGDHELELDTDIYVDFSQSRLATRGGTVTDNYNRYTDEDGVIHPAVIILEEEGINGVPEAASRSSRSGKVFYTAEDIAKSNADFRIINVNQNLGNHSLSNKEKGLTIYAKNTHLKAISGVRINISTKWFKLKKFECAVYGDFGLKATAGVEATLPIKGWESETNIAKFNCFTAVFWVGVIPVSVHCNAGATMGASAEINASCQFESKFELNASYDAGVYYSGNWSNRNTASASAKAEFSVVKPLAVTAEASTGITMFAELKLYNCAGPKITFGPSIGYNVEAALNALDKKLEVSSTGEMNIGGKYGVEVKIWKWKLASWQQKYSVFNKEIWNIETEIKL